MTFGYHEIKCDVNTLSPEEINLIRSRNISRRSEFMDIAKEVCAIMEVPFSDITAVTRGNSHVCEARALICRIAFDRGFHPKLIGQYIRRDRTTVIHAIEKTREERLGAL